MKNTTTLFLLNKATPDEVISEMADAAVEANTHLGCMLLNLVPSLPARIQGVPPYGAMSIPDDWGEQLEEANSAQNERVQQIEAILARSNASGDVQSTLLMLSEIRAYVARKARVSDLAMIAPNLRDSAMTFQEAAHGVLLESPIGLMVNPTTMPPERIFIAWDSSNAASRAVHIALPQLKAAKEVVIGCFDPVATIAANGADPGTGLAAWLSHHGCAVTVSQYPSGGTEIGQCIQDRAREVGADLIVMGAYGDSRILQAVFGGTTRTMMTQTGMPVLFAH